MGVIQQLPEDVVRKIAAGEVIVRPANAVKELIENSLDAGATEITVTIKEGGMTLLQVKDNGTGIYKDDLPLVCERFATSKLRSIDDLSRMTTFGFRGEALASIAMVSSLNVTSKRRDAPCAYQIAYKNGAMTGRIRPSAGGDGTTITVDGLFEASESRRAALKNHAEESARVIDIVAKYAVHRPDVSFIVMRDERGCDLRSLGTGKREDVLGVLYGDELCKEALVLRLNDPTLHFEMEGIMASPYSIHSAEAKDSKRKRNKQFVLFINNRPVSCAVLKSSTEQTLASKGLATTYLMMALMIDPSRVDVNVHPTKDCVFFLQQDDVTERIQEYLDAVLEADINKYRPKLPSLQSMMEAQMLAPLGLSRSSDSVKTPQPTKSDSSEKRCDYNLVRVSGSERRLEQFFLPGHSSAHATVDTVDAPSSQEDYRVTESGTREFSLESIESLRQSVIRESSTELRAIFKGHFVVGCASPECVLLQHDTTLYACTLQTLLEEIMYQIILFSLGNLGSYRLDEPLPVVELLKASGCEEGDEQLKEAATFLSSKASMLNDFFSLNFEEIQETDGGEARVCITTLPSLIHAHSPQMAALPELILCLLVEVDWDEEIRCIEGVARSIAAFYGLHKRWLDGDLYSSDGNTKWTSVKDRLFPPSKWTEAGILTPLTSIHDLYKIFERC
ncbi:mlh-1 [Pristionchus pacificus]|uniref:Mlh-1 n=1 Tax=Pristionchus pacificus TaxID=54126 RepID=A0A2A6BPS0_PRIPA|nr:mlh-1 [Pristionchus pacificus]|eukprot:PDM67900.1 mlh-1 [Pristionchus pacificus]